MRSREADIVLNLGAWANRHVSGICLIEVAKRDLVAPDFAQEILKDLDRQLLARASAIAKAERSETGIVANRTSSAVDAVVNGLGTQLTSVFSSVSSQLGGGSS